MTCLAARGQAQREQEALRQLAGEHHVDVAEVHLRLRPRQMRLQNERVFHLDTGISGDLGSPARDVVPDRGVGDVLSPVLVDQPRQDPAGGVPLLTRRRNVGQQHRVDVHLQRVQLRRLADWRLPLRRHRIGQRLAHRRPADPVPACQLADRQLLALRVPPDLLELRHPRPRHPGLPSAEAQWKSPPSSNTIAPGGSRSGRHKPWRVDIRPPGGSESSRHSGSGSD